MRAMIVSILLNCFLSACVFGEHHVSCSTKPVQPEEDGDFTLQCRLHPPVSLVDVTLVVSRPDFRDEVVHVYRDGGDLAEAQTSWYRDRTSLDHEDLQRGIITLNISSLQLSDRGQYRLFIPDLKVHHDINITVAEKGRGLGTTTRTEAPRTRETPDAEPQRKHHAAIVGGVVGGVVGVVLLGLIVGVLVKRGKINLSSVSTAARSWWGVLYKHGYTAGRKEREPSTDRDAEQETVAQNQDGRLNPESRDAHVAMEIYSLQTACSQPG